MEKQKAGNNRIKIPMKDFTKIPTGDLIKMRKEMNVHLITAQLKGRTQGVLGFNLPQERRNIARINTELKRREDAKS